MQPVHAGLRGACIDTVENENLQHVRYHFGDPGYLEVVRNANEKIITRLEALAYFVRWLQKKQKTPVHRKSTSEQNQPLACSIM